MFLVGTRIDGNIVEVDNDEFVEERMKYVIDEGLEHCGCICETKWHNQEFVFPISRIERRFVNVFICNPHLAVS